MKSFFQKNHRLLFYAAWIVLGLIQSRFTELQDDEAYYWVYSKYPDFGYFDHPPMIALLIKMGYSVFPNELGVRLFPLILNILSLFITERLLANKNPVLFYAITLSIAALQLAGFIAIPDIPLIFFTALFFLVYRNFTEKQTWRNILLLGISIALLFYTKYHAVLIVFFTLLSNIKLFTKPQLYLAGIVALVLFSPHLLWQWEHNWVSFRYHLFESNVNAYKFSFTADYIAGQVLLAGPIAGFVLLPAAFLHKSKTQTEKALKWNMIGLYIFFLLSSFRGKVEANWTSPVLVSLIVLSHQYLNEKLSLQKWILRLLPLTLLLVVFVRIIMIEDLLPVNAIKKRFHAWKQWPQEMNKLTKGLPVVFSNSYQRASKYWFYSGQMTYSQNDVSEHRNNYNFWPIEDELLGKPVYFLDIYRLNRFDDSLKTPIGSVGYRYDNEFASFARVNIKTNRNSYTIKENEELKFYCSGYISEHYRSFLETHPEIVYRINMNFFNTKGLIQNIPLPFKFYNFSQSGLEVKVKTELPPGKYYMQFSIEVPGYNPTHNSEKIKLIVE
jgi:hypothetical protein